MPRVVDAPAYTNGKRGKTANLVICCFQIEMDSRDRHRRPTISKVEYPDARGRGQWWRLAFVQVNFFDHGPGTEHTIARWHLFSNVFTVRANYLNYQFRERNLGNFNS